MQTMKFMLTISFQKEINLVENLNIFGKCFKVLFFWKIIANSCNMNRHDNNIDKCLSDLYPLHDPSSSSQLKKHTTFFSHRFFCRRSLNRVVISSLIRMQALQFLISPTLNLQPPPHSLPLTGNLQYGMFAHQNVGYILHRISNAFLLLYLNSIFGVLSGQFYV